MPDRLSFIPKAFYWFIGIIISIGAAAKVLYSFYKVVKYLDDRLEDDKDRNVKILHEMQYIKTVQRFILQNFNTAWYFTDIDGKTLDCSDKCLDIMECSRSQVIGENWTEFIVEAEKTEVYNEFRMKVAAKSDFSKRFNTYTGKSNKIKVHSHAKFAGIGYFGTLEVI
jgi:PAS domain-containing protein